MFQKLICEEHTISPEVIANPIDGGTPEEELAALLALRVGSKSAFVSVLTAFDNHSALELSAPNEKAAEAIRDKARRPEILAAKPWFRIRHIRDSLRARGAFDQMDDLFDLLQETVKLQYSEFISIVKFDADKFFRPKIWGWRMISLDIRLSSYGLITEFYASYRQLIDVNQRVAHAYYEKWREKDQENMSLLEQRQFQRDVAFCRVMFEDALRRSLISDQSEVLRRTRSSAKVVGGLSHHAAALDRMQQRAMAALEDIFRKAAAVD